MRTKSIFLWSLTTCLSCECVLFFLWNTKICLWNKRSYHNWTEDAERKFSYCKL